MQPLTAPNGAVVIGTPGAEVLSTPTARRIANGETYRSEPVEVPRGAATVSFEVQLTPSGPCAAVVSIRSGNRYQAVLPIEGDSEASNFDSFSAVAVELVALDADCNWLQVEITPTGADVDALVIGTCK